MSYHLDNVEFDFRRVTTEDALKVKSAMMILANEKAPTSTIIEANSIIDDLAFKYVKIKDKKGQWLETQSADEAKLIANSMFENEFASIEIVAKFQERLQGFLSALPSFQKAKK